MKQDHLATIPMRITAIQKGSTGAFTVGQIKKAAETARIKGEEVRAKIKELTRAG